MQNTFSWHFLNRSRTLCSFATHFLFTWQIKVHAEQLFIKKWFLSLAKKKSFCFKERSRRGEKRGNFSVTSDETLPSQPRDPVAKNFLHSYDFLIFSFILLENHSKSLILDLRIRFLKEIGFENNLVIEKSLKIGKIACLGHKRHLPIFGQIWKNWAFKV